MGIFSPGGSIPGTVSSSIVGPGLPTIFNTTITTANVEQSYTLPAGTKRLLVKTHEADLKTSFISGTSGTNYLTVPRNCFYSDGDLTLAGPMTLYFQSALAGMRVEILTWS